MVPRGTVERVLAWLVGLAVVVVAVTVAYAGTPHAAEPAKLAVVDGDPEAFADDRGNLPADAQLVELEGVDHSQFGAYGGQRGDRPAGLSDVEARLATTRVLARWFENRSRAA